MSFDFADKAVEDFYLLFPASVLTFDRFMDNDFFNQRIQKFGGQFCWIDALFHQGNPFFCVCGVLAFSGDSGLKLFNLCVQFSLFALVLPGQHREVVFCDTPRRPVLIHPGKQGIDFGFPLLCLFQFGGLLLSCGGPLSLAFNSRFKSRSSSCCTSPDQYCRRERT